jgi:hypothetical protein
MEVTQWLGQTNLTQSKMVEPEAGGRRLLLLRSKENIPYFELDYEGTFCKKRKFTSHTSLFIYTFLHKRHIHQQY